MRLHAAIILAFAWLFVPTPAYAGSAIELEARLHARKQGREYRPPPRKTKSKVQSGYQWESFTIKGFCTAEMPTKSAKGGEEAGADIAIPTMADPFGSNGGTFDLHQSTLRGPGGEVVLTRKSCGPKPQPPAPPPSQEEIEETFRDSAELKPQLSAMPLGTPERPGLTGLASQFSIEVQPQRLTHQFSTGWTVQLTATPGRVQWDFDDLRGCEQRRSATNINTASHSYCRKGLHTVTAYVEWHAEIDFDGPVSIPRATTGEIHSEAELPYDVISARGCLDALGKRCGRS